MLQEYATLFFLLIISFFSSQNYLMRDILQKKKNSIPPSFLNNSTVPHTHTIFFFFFFLYNEGHRKTRFDKTGKDRIILGEKPQSFCTNARKTRLFSPELFSILYKIQSATKKMELKITPATIEAIATILKYY